MSKAQVFFYYKFKAINMHAMITIDKIIRRMYNQDDHNIA